MAPRVQRRSWRIARRLFRWCRITVLLVLLGVVISGIYLNQVGIPDFIKQPLLAKLRARGVELQFTRLRLRWYRGIVAEHVHFALNLVLPVVTIELDGLGEGCSFYGLVSQWLTMILGNSISFSRL